MSTTFSRTPPEALAAALRFFGECTEMRSGPTAISSPGCKLPSTAGCPFR